MRHARCVVDNNQQALVSVTGVSNNSGRGKKATTAGWQENEQKDIAL
jgi:hypothetical protein